jgi:uncharacterized protein YijF (DUF1287 family)
MSDIDRILRSSSFAALGLVLLLAAGCQRPFQKRAADTPPASIVQPLRVTASPQLKQFIEAAIEQSKITTGYDPSYVKLDYPNGDVPSDTGVCSDVVVRAFRKAGLICKRNCMKT